MSGRGRSISLEPEASDEPSLAQDSAAARTCPGCNVPLQEGEERCALCRWLDEHSAQDLRPLPDR
jgi:hypothetical protein